MIFTTQLELPPYPTSPTSLCQYFNIHVPPAPTPFSFYQVYLQNISNTGGDIFLTGLPSQSGYYLVKAGKDLSIRIQAGDDLGIGATHDNTVTTLVNVLIVTG
jgi:hypothetical protein